MSKNIRVKGSHHSREESRNKHLLEGEISFGECFEIFGKMWSGVGGACWDTFPLWVPDIPGSWPPSCGMFWNVIESVWAVEPGRSEAMLAGASLHLLGPLVWFSSSQTWEVRNRIGELVTAALLESRGQPGAEMRW